MNTRLVINIIHSDCAECLVSTFDIVLYSMLEDVIKVITVWNCEELQRLKRKAFVKHEVVFWLAKVSCM